MENDPVLPTSLVAILAKLPMSCVATFLFNSHFSASAAAKAVFVMALTAFPFIAGAFIAEAFIAGGNISPESLREGCGLCATRKLA